MVCVIPPQSISNNDIQIEFFFGEVMLSFNERENSLSSVKINFKFENRPISRVFFLLILAYYFAKQLKFNHTTKESSHFIC